MYTFQCDLAAQNCASLYPNGAGFWPLDPDAFPQFFNNTILPFTESSCVQDVRLPGTVGRCGFPGAACSVILGKYSNCAAGFASICVNGKCTGEVGSPCGPNYTFGASQVTDNCNFGMGCGSDLICGGVNSRIINNEHLDVGLDTGRDYCVSGVVALAPGSTSAQMCAPGPPLVIPSPSSSSTSAPLSSRSSTSESSTAPATNTPSTIPTPRSPSAAGHKTTPVAAVAGGVVGGVAVVLLLLLGLFLWRKKNAQPHPSEKMNSASPQAAFLSNTGSRLPTLASGTVSPYIPEQAHWQMPAPLHQHSTGPSSTSGAGSYSEGAVNGASMRSDIGKEEHPPDYDFV
ncbi:hypothetical protein B0H19DRAFT_1375773 [Mycena capillaripes]|nr:hypothetical protein B0H19DRAFT_1375773 [Mycena capillaripes]